MIRVHKRTGRKYHRGQEYREMRRIVAERERGICVGCETKFKTLHCHHLLAERFLRRMKARNVHHIVNGAGLCARCHAQATHEAEPMLFAGNLLGFLQCLNRIGRNLYLRARVAAFFYGIDVSRINL